MRSLLQSLRLRQLRIVLAWVLVIGGFADAQDQIMAAHDASPGPVIGVVVDAQGAWCAQIDTRCRDLFKMYPVAEGSRLIAKPPVTQPRTITVRFRSGVKETFDCFSPRELGCRGPLDLSRFVVREPGKTVIGAFLDAVMELAGAQPKVYDSLRQGILQSRGLHPQGLSDGVAQKTEHGLDVEAILSSLPAGEYLLELCPLDEAEKPACSENSAPVDYPWNPAKPVSYPAPGARPGMYRMYRWDNSAGLSRRSREYADVLVADAAKYPALSENFHRVVAATRKWDADDVTAPALRRAYLYSLSRE